MATIGKVSAVFTASTSGLRSGVNQAASSMATLERAAKSTASGMRALVAIQGTQLFGGIVSGVASAASKLIGVASSLTSAIGGAVQQATSLGEETSKSGVLFGNAAGQIAEFAKSASAIGLSESAALQATGTFGNLFKAMGLGVDVSAEYSTRLTKLGADLASFNNTSVDDAVMAIGAALRGESEPIRRFGVLLDEATLKQEAFNAGLIESTKGSLTPAIKAQAAYAAILKQTAAAQGDFERTSGSLANLGRVVQAQSANIFGDIGKAFEPLVTSATSVISKVLQVVRPFVASVSDGVGAALSKIGQALEGLVPAFEAFVGGLDGGAIGERIGEGIISGARYLAQIGDSIIQGVPAAWRYVQGLADVWSGVFELGKRVFDYFAAVGRSIEGWFKLGGSILTGIIGRLLNAAGELAQVVSGGAFGQNIEQSGEALMGISSKLWDESGQAFEAYVENASNAVFGRDKARAAGEDLAGPLEQGLDAALATARQAAASIQQATARPVEVRQVAAAEVNMEPVKKAVEGIDSRSSEGLRTMFRIMRGDTGNDVQERIAKAAERTADAVEGQNGQQQEFQVVDIAA